MPGNRLILWLLLLSVPGSLAIALLTGSSAIGAGDLWSLLQGKGNDITATVIELRASRALDGLIVGGLLAMAGALLQVLLRNPLAEPYILGISGGAGAMALAAMLVGISTLWMPVAALAGAVVSSLLVFSIGFSRGSWTPTRLLLTGVVIAAGWGACISFMLSLSSERQVHGMLFWLMGDLAHTQGSGAGLVILVAGLLYGITIARSLNLLGGGEMHAAALGENIMRLRVQVFLLAAIMTSTSVSMAGSIGFIGLIVPHTLRLAGLRNYRQLLPACALAGGSFLVLADTVSRSWLAPQQIPVGVITALLGVPVFLFLLQRQYGNTA